MARSRVKVCNSSQFAERSELGSQLSEDELSNVSPGRVVREQGLAG